MLLLELSLELLHSLWLFWRFRLSWLSVVVFLIFGFSISLGCISLGCLSGLGDYGLLDSDLFFFLPVLDQVNFLEDGDVMHGVLNFETDLMGGLVFLSVFEFALRHLVLRNNTRQASEYISILSILELNMHISSLVVKGD